MLINLPQRGHGLPRESLFAALQASLDLQHQRGHPVPRYAPLIALPTLLLVHTYTDDKAE
ncbi:uncharacterized protein TrAtP1_001689 [Trichoderma atroviride]|uniref:Uncharacterized protein n=1 Tax=Hypocrea atroviridis (strain ATCC 20476 / IMI 206040) TaxID=452589 RepID=G9P0D4_HYPAI|nr:uncharacterized protein TRIATDRAFT_310685 [Trichoderma atroviride IMI 206040]EHK43125.1 hypothetical protein TRIATDRAFT_310685 [Trichoderma atroviride IMI 206040]UKZ60409.1 hypothetical protein TrAtP1_001689 [Trichoderma atroviride]